MASTITNPGASDQSAANLSSGTGIAQITGKVSLQSPATNRSAGSGANQVDRAYAYTGSVTAGTPFTINLSSGSDQLANALGMVHATRVHVLHQGTTGKLAVGAGTHPVMVGDVATLQPGGSCIMDNGGVGYKVLTTSSQAGVSPVEALPVVDTTGSGTFTLTYMGITTGAITYSATVATLITNINTALDSAFGAGNLVASGASLAALIITGSAGNYQFNAFGGHFTSTITGTGFTINGSATAGTSTTSVAGVEHLTAQADTATITADAGTIPFSLVVLGRSA